MKNNADCVYMAAPDHNIVANVDRMKERGYHNVILGGGADPHLTWSQATREEVASMMHCEALHLPRNWEQNPTARLLHHLALDLSITVLYERA